MPQKDYDIESLLTRISALERRLDEGVFVKNEGGRVEMNPVSTVSTPTPAPKQELKKETEKDEYETADFDVPPEMDVPPDEAETGGSVYFDAGFLPPKRTEKKTPEPTPVPPQPVAAPTPAIGVKKPLSGDAKTTFGTFLRALRRAGKSGVLFTLCMDLDSAYEDGKFLLYTGSDTIFRSLTKAEHYTILKDTFATIGIEEDGFEIRQKGKKSEGVQKDVETIKATFSGVKIEVK
jgi:hypothetical protein